MYNSHAKGRPQSIDETFRNKRFIHGMVGIISGRAYRGGYSICSHLCNIGFRLRIWRREKTGANNIPNTWRSNSGIVRSCSTECVFLAKIQREILTSRFQGMRSISSPMRKGMMYAMTLNIPGICPECGAKVSVKAPRCWMCSRPLSWDTPLADTIPACHAIQRRNLGQSAASRRPWRTKRLRAPCDIPIRPGVDHAYHYPCRRGIRRIRNGPGNRNRTGNRGHNGFDPHLYNFHAKGSRGSAAVASRKNQLFCGLVGFGDSCDHRGGYRIFCHLLGGSDRHYPFTES